MALQTSLNALLIWISYDIRIFSYFEKWKILPELLFTVGAISNQITKKLIIYAWKWKWSILNNNSAELQKLELIELIEITSLTKLCSLKLQCDLVYFMKGVYEKKMYIIICFSNMQAILRRYFLRTQMLHIGAVVIPSFNFIAICYVGLVLQ